MLGTPYALKTNKCGVSVSGLKSVETNTAVVTRQVRHRIRLPGWPEALFLELSDHIPRCNVEHANFIIRVADRAPLLIDLDIGLISRAVFDVVRQITL